MTVEVTYNPDMTDPESLAGALDSLIETALSTPGIMDDYGEVEITGFTPGAEARLVVDAE